jgi:TetR/AcrR family transcriptional repressor of nem operon
MRSMKKTDVYSQILETAESLIQTQGYNAFSYKDIADKVGVKTSSIHYYFPTKADLGKEIVKLHIDALCAELDIVVHKTHLSCRKKLDLFIDAIVAKTFLDDRKMCLGGMLAADVLTLPVIIQKEVKQFFNRLEQWLQRLLSEAITKKELRLTEKELKNEAMVILSQLEGALLLARLFQDEGHLAAARRHIMARFK